VGEPTREEVERVVAGLTEAQREAILGFTAELPWRLMTEATAKAEFPPGLLKRSERYDGWWHKCFCLSPLGRAVAAALRRGNTPPPGEGDGGRGADAGGGDA
jgi:hypothetical protein